ncbi:MAG: ATP-dependent DNA ligase [Deltaproteobacteria bacterium]|nr:ATP-dependent DNA ligase [Deltaproteobacteria bacterium]
MLATLTDERFSDPGWIYERKLDGVRCLAFRHGEELRLMSRNQKPMNATWPELVDALAAQPARDFVVDGEIVAFDGALTSFSRLQGRIGVRSEDEARARGVAVHLYVFDLLHLDGWDLCGLALRDRKRLLKAALSFDGRLRFVAHRNEDGEAWLEEACAKGWEGLIAKDASSEYVHSRSRAWLKFKCAHGQELVIAGYTEPKGSRRGFGALLVGYYEDGALRYAGKVGTGFDDQTLEAMSRRLRRLERKTSPFEDAVREPGAHFVTPELVGEFGFTEWTRSGKLRHPRFLGLREDKGASEVRRERPEGGDGEA